MYYPRFTKVIVNFFMTKDQSIPKRNKVNWHFARDDYMFTTIKAVSRHEYTQLYGAILPNELTNEAIKDSKSYKEYYAIASRAEPPKTKASVKKKQVRSEKSKTPLTAKGKTLKTYAKAAKTAKKKQPAKTSKAKGLTVLSEQTRALDVLTYGSDDEKISWKSSDEENNDDDNDEDDDENDQDNDDDDDDANNQDEDGQEDDNEQTDSDNDGDDFVHPKLYTHDEEDKEED
ncbi:putative reverse transcriptase domain-containing protein, partial [Tanacetum coccineum]